MITCITYLVLRGKREQLAVVLGDKSRQTRDNALVCLVALDICDCAEALEGKVLWEACLQFALSLAAREHGGRGRIDKCL